MNKNKDVHELKLLHEYFIEVVKGNKTFEVRLFDRDYKIGDLLKLKEFDPEKGFSGKSITKEITYMLADENYVKKDYVILGIRNIEGW